ncbi:MAG: hypothetical protein Edafosvirus3_2 [Edafosvirus sp.]|uniref:Uncharacterized protein n=1 Tax=Edafosvirus sp. TaxID=2487765 RepID=A0A3G4ZUD0_9VIRU|nr:MAG: hypothetical protein Edafosvirus3_2 [Edafosvirus sp.]
MTYELKKTCYDCSIPYNDNFVMCCSVNFCDYCIGDHYGQSHLFDSTICVTCCKLIISSDSVGYNYCCGLTYCNDCYDMHKESHTKLLTCCDLILDIRTRCQYCKLIIHEKCNYANHPEKPMCRKCSYVNSIKTIKCKNDECDTILNGWDTVRCDICWKKFCQPHVKKCKFCFVEYCMSCSETHMCAGNSKLCNGCNHFIFLNKFTICVACNQDHCNDCKSKHKCLHCEIYNCSPTETKPTKCDMCNSFTNHPKITFIPDKYKCRGKQIFICCYCLRYRDYLKHGEHKKEHNFCYPCSKEFCDDDSFGLCMNCNAQVHIDHIVEFDNKCHMCIEEKKDLKIKATLCCDCKINNQILINCICDHFKNCDINVIKIIASYFKLCLPIHENPIHKKFNNKCNTCNKNICNNHKNRNTCCSELTNISDDIMDEINDVMAIFSE